MDRNMKRNSEENLKKDRREDLKENLQDGLKQNRKRKCNVCKLLACAFCVFLLGSFFTGCKEVELTKHLRGSAVVGSIAPDLEGVKSCDYEQVDKAYRFLGQNLSLAPSDPRYRGILILSEEEGQKLWESANDWELSDTPLPDLGDVDTSSIQGEDWYYSRVLYDYFNILTFPSYLSFNGKDTIVFDVQTH